MGQQVQYSDSKPSVQGAQPGDLWIRKTGGGIFVYDTTAKDFLQMDYPTLSAKTFGAKADGVTDDYSALQMLFDTAAAQPGAIVVLAPGNYLVKKTLSITAPITIHASGGSPVKSVFFGSRIVAGAAMTDLVNVNIAAGSANQDSGERMEDLALDGNSLADNVLTITGSLTTKSLYGNIHILKGLHFGVNITGNHSHHFFHCVITGNGSGSVNDAGINISGSVPPNDNQFFFCNIEDNRGNGVLIASGNDNAIIGGVIENNDFHGVYQSGNVRGTTVIRVALEANNRVNVANIYDIYIPTGNHFYIEACSFSLVNETFAIWNGGTETMIVDTIGASAGTIHWDSTASGGLYLGDPASLDGTSSAIPVLRYDATPNLGLYFGSSERIRFGFNLGGVANPGMTLIHPVTGRTMSFYLVNGAIEIEGNASDPVRIRVSNFQLYDGTNAHFTFNNASNIITKYKNTTTVGLGFPALYGLDNRSGLTSADGSPITLYPVPTGAGQLFRVSIDIFATAVTGGTATYTLTWTENGGARTIAASASVVNTLASLVDLINPDASTNITVQLTFAAFTGTLKVAGVAEEIA